MTKTGTGTNLGFEIEDNSVFAKVYSEYEKNNTIFNENNIIGVGQQVVGVIQSINDKYALIDFDYKTNIIVDMDITEKIIIDELSVGDNVACVITEIIDNKQGFTIKGSLHQVKMLNIDNFLNLAVENKTVLTGTPIEYNEHGYIVLVNINEENIGLFMPHLLTDVNKLPDPNSIINTEIEFILDKFTKDNKNNFIVSRKKYLMTLIKEETKKLVVGELYEGFITGTINYGIFVQFKTCLTCMIHKSNLSDIAIDLLEKGELQNGQKIEFYIKDIQGKNINATQVFRESLLDTIQVNDILLGKVSSIKLPGILVDLDHESKGLIHENKLNGKTFNLNDEIKVYVTKIDKNKRQITLALYDEQ